jgi:hypothetical protein
MSWRITFNIIGDNFSPKKMKFKFHEQNENDEIALKGRSKGEKYGYGSASYVVPKNVKRPQKFRHLADTFEPLLDELKNCGAENWYIEIGRLYHNQCNEEFDTKEILDIARLKCSLSYSAYSVSEEEEKIGFD